MTAKWPGAHAAKQNHHANATTSEEAINKMVCRDEKFWSLSVGVASNHAAGDDGTSQSSTTCQASLSAVAAAAPPPLLRRVVVKFGDNEALLTSGEE